MSRKFRNIDLSNLEGLDIEFCTTCEEALDDWFMNPDSFDLDGVKANHENCKHIGKFKGEMCARLFISMNGKSEEIFKDEDD